MNCMDEWIGTGNPVRVIDALVEALNIDELGFAKAKLERVWMSMNFTTQKDLTQTSATLHIITSVNHQL